MTLTLTLLVDCAGTLEGDRTAAVNAVVKMFVAALPDDVLVRILRYSDTAMWHLGPDPVPAGEVAWRDLPSGGYLSSLAHAVNLAGQTLSASSESSEIALLISDGAMSDPEELVEMVLARRFSGSVIRASATLTPAADCSVLRMFAGDRVFDPEIFADPRPFLASVGGKLPAASVPAPVSPTLCCSLDLGDEVAQEKIAAHMQRLL